jgi:hypothetical protein
MKNQSKKRLNTEKTLKMNDSFNSFLVETTFNSDIDLTIRKEIDKKFHKSKQLSTKPSFESFAKTTTVHKPSKSSIINLCNLDLKPADRLLTKKVTFDLDLFDSKKEKSRNLSCRNLKNDSLGKSKSKSPKSAKKQGESGNKIFSTNCKKPSGECVNKIFTTSSTKGRMISTAASMRLKKIYHNGRAGQV